MSLQMVSFLVPDFEYAPLSRPALFDRDLNTHAGKLNYSRQQLLTLRFKSTPQPDFYQFLKVQGIFKTRRIRSCILTKQSSGFHKINSAFSIRKSSIWKPATSGVNCAD